MTPHAAETRSSMKDDLAKAILSQIREDEVVAMCCEVVNIPSPTGEELEMGRYMRKALEEMGLAVSWQEVEDARANVVGLWEGTGNGKSLMFNGHMDTSNTGCETFLTGLGYKPKAVVRDKMIYGLGIYNMKGALVCYMQAVRALMRAGVKLEGDVTIAAVVGEIEKTQWSDEFVGKEFRGYGVGTHHLVNHGVLPDMCLLGEPTDMQLVLGHYGTVWVRLSTRGHYVHTGFTRGKQGHSSIFRMKQILDLRKKHPDYGIESEIFVSVPGAEISKDHQLVKTVESCHQRVLGTAPKHATVLWDSDASVMTRFGIETLNYGPSSGPREAEGEKVAIATLVSTTKVYALAAAEICGAH